MSSKMLLSANYFIQVGLIITILQNSLDSLTNAQITFDLNPQQEPENKPCTSPDGLQGECINILQCRPVLQLLRRRPIPTEVANYLRKSVCEFKDNLPIICCVRPQPAPTTTTTVTTPTTTTTTSPITTSKTTIPSLGICGKSDASVRIIGGVLAELHAWPWIAALGFEVFSSLMICNRQYF